jgi:hypothetical protein
MCKTTIESSPAILALQKKWAEAKANEAGWKDIKWECEKKILEALKAGGIELPETGSLCLEKLNITFGNTRSWDQPSLTEVAIANPHMIGSVLITEYKVALTKPKVDKLVAGGTEAGQAIAECFEDKPKKPSFSEK